MAHKTSHRAPARSKQPAKGKAKTRNAKARTGRNTSPFCSNAGAELRILQTSKAGRDLRSCLF